MNALVIAIIAALSGVAGASLGSFAGVVSGRGWRGAMAGRSRCEGCGRTLHWYELLPLASYALQGGRCRSCGTRIGPQALVVEVAGAVVGIAVALVVLGLVAGAG
jgi:leader peptidase (prepilin peptidase)/N-methyltransferase